MRLNSGKSSSRIFYVEQRAAGSKATCSSDVKELKDPQMKFSGNIEYHRAHVNSLVNLNFT